MATHNGSTTWNVTVHFNVNLTGSDLDSFSLWQGASSHTEEPWATVVRLGANLTDCGGSAADHVTTGMDGTADGLANKPWNLLRQSMAMIIILSFAYVVVFILAIVNNSLVVAVIYRNPQLRTVTNYFIANLAIADIMISILVLPITLLSNLFEGTYVGVLIIFRGHARLNFLISFIEYTKCMVDTERYIGGVGRVIKSLGVGKVDQKQKWHAHIPDIS